ncbi:DUF3397 domain-containing protein [Enterococcus dispar]|uniref:Lipoprotein n=1 Tax=Enterococcus dispar ATCC 51266 TaxID=1139219 RepID=S0KJK8_9ENTE|nr:DUF3397 domain-containing protein [Enterococcus dispar]EOT41175.1 hypothetical protein OMK_01344 [Enterococcus dispar ATCC 51266]EOW87191.1 hypothetical protein I569_02562 [Enterococcus dispar ATCC 51266]MCU7356481.1 DUF3397 domain-containing protein [Enterococcus dispar]OJG38674.1 hypothetical protein RV01_GL002120 [Enterococcus dispar]WCG33765.1 DUF3397 domain-containing protein [Enterococcus dispar]
MEKFTPLLAFWYIFPVIVLVACNFLVTTFALTKRFKIKAPDLAVPFLFLGINQASQATFAFSALPYFIIGLLVLGIGLAIFHAYFYGELAYGRYLKMFWRLVFLLTMVFYVFVIVLSLWHFL